MEVVAVLGASNDTNRYSHKAMKMLKEYGHRPIPIHPNESEVLGYQALPDLKSLINQNLKVDTLTVYVNPGLSAKLGNDILELNPKRVIFNPGSENPTLEKLLKDKGIEVEEACTLVLLRSNQFLKKKWA